MTQHSKEPWTAEGTSVHSEPGEGQTVHLVADLDEEKSYLPFGTAEANAARIAACVTACAGIPLEELQIIAEGGETFVDTHKRLQAQVDALTGAVVHSLPRTGHHLVTLLTDNCHSHEVSRRLEAFRDMVAKSRADGHTNARFTLLSSAHFRDIQFTEFDHRTLGKIGMTRREDFDKVLSCLRELMTPAVERSPTKWADAKIQARKLLKEFGGDQ